jgi:predicted DCC family thiol-disulfide oxidoreductase YuxK
MFTLCNIALQKINSLIKWSQQYFHIYLAIDPRAMGLFRIIFGTLCFLDIALRIPHLELLYASTGLFPNSQVFADLVDNQPYLFSLLYSFNTPPTILAFLVFSLFCVFCFTIGWKTRIFQVLSALCMISIHNRNDILQNGGDLVHNLWWMWTIVLPLGNRWSVDQFLHSWQTPDHDDTRLNRIRPKDISPYYTLALLGILLNLAVCYFLNAVHKTGITWTSGHAVAYTLEQDRITLPLGYWIRHLLPVWGFQILTWGTLATEGAAVLLLLSPWKNKWCRRIILLLLGGFHLGVAFTLQIGFFSYWMVSIYFILLHPDDLDAMARWVKPRRIPLQVFYDSDCGVCHACARIVSRLDTYRLMTWIGRTQEKPDIISEEEFVQLRENTLIVWDSQANQYWTTHQAVSKIFTRLPFLSWLGALVWLTGPLGSWVYRTFANHRHRVSEWLGYGLCGLQPLQSKGVDPSLPPLNGPRRFMNTSIRVSLEIYVVLMMITMGYAAIHHNRFFKKMSKPVPPSWVRSVIRYGNFRQSWRLFSPEAPVKDGWIVYETTLSDGRVIDARTGIKPDYRIADYHRRTWPFYEARLDFRLNQDKGKMFKNFLKWMRTRTHRFRLTPKDRIVDLKLYWVGDHTKKLGPKYYPPKPLGKRLVHSWSLKKEQKKRRADYIAKRKKETEAKRKNENNAKSKTKNKSKIDSKAKIQNIYKSKVNKQLNTINKLIPKTPKIQPIHSNPPNPKLTPYKALKKSPPNP